jgi:CheY-like chemotaxis protein
MRILVIDDELVVRKAISTIVRLAGHECKEAANALAGIACAEQDAFDLVLLDMNMPGLHGLEALKAIAHMEPRVPVVVMSGASGGTDFQVLALRLGGVAFLRKPFSRAELINALTVQSS